MSGDLARLSNQRGAASARGSLGDDPASREAAESQKNSTDNKQPLGDLRFYRCRDRLLVQFSDYSGTTFVCCRKFALRWQVAHAHLAQGSATIFWDKQGLSKPTRFLYLADGRRSATSGST